MSLQGTLSDFGIADIFQLIGHQSKTGVLVLQDRSRDVVVRISFVDGSVVKAEQSTRNKAELLGAVMVRARVLSQQQLDHALTTQARTLQRLGDVLIDQKICDRATIKEFARLQTTETIYRLFSWRTGTYQFVVQTIDYDASSYDPIRAENVLMEGFRMVDEWPAIRKIIPNVRCTFRVVSAPGLATTNDDDDDLLAGLDDALSGEAVSGPRLRGITDADRVVFGLVTPSRTVQNIADVARMGEFDATRSLSTLVGHGHLVVIAAPDEEEVAEPLTRAAVLQAARPMVVRLAATIVAAGLLFAVIKAATWSSLSPLQSANRVRVAATSDLNAAQQRRQVEGALRVFRAETGLCPRTLDELVQASLITETAAHGVDKDPWRYRIAPDRSDCSVERAWQ